MDGRLQVIYLVQKYVAQDKYQLKDGYLVLANNQFLALSPTTKYSMVPAKAFCCDLYLVETRAHCFVPAHSSQQEGLSRPSFRLPCAQALDQERPRPL